MIDKDKNVICLVVDRLRASALGAYGNTWWETPDLDRLAAESFVLDLALIDSPRLETIYRGYWQGLHAMQPDAAGRDALVLPAALGDAGFATTLLTDEPSVADQPAADAFDELVRVDPAPGGGTQVADTIDAAETARLFATAVDWLDQRSDSLDAAPFFLWIHAQGMAGAWDAPLELRQSLVEQDDPQPPDSAEVPCRYLADDYDPDELFGVTCMYAGQVMLLDQCVGALVERLRESQLDKTTLLVILGARGLPLGEHRRVGAVDDALHSETLHVPWLMRFPEGTGAATHNASIVQPADLYATLLDWLNVDVSEVSSRSRFGKSLMPVARGESEVVRDRAGMIAPDGERAIRTSAWYLRQPPAASQQPDDAETAELYAKPDDRWDVNEVANRCPEIVDELIGTLAQFEQALQSKEPTRLAPLSEALVSDLD